MKDNDGAAFGGTLDSLVGHVCFYCCKGFDQTTDNPSRTDFCAKCGHRGEGIKRTMTKGDWGILTVMKPCKSCNGRGKWTDDRRGKGDTFDGQSVESVRWKCCVCKGTGRMPNDSITVGGTPYRGCAGSAGGDA